MDLHNAGLKFNHNIWDPQAQQIFTSPQLSKIYGLHPSELTHWERTRRRLAGITGRLLIQSSSSPLKDEWVGLYPAHSSHCSSLVFQGKLTSECIFSQHKIFLLVPKDKQAFVIQQRTQKLHP
jgi:hypothetical protein